MQVVGGALGDPAAGAGQEAADAHLGVVGDGVVGGGVAGGAAGGVDAGEGVVDGLLDLGVVYIADVAHSGGQVVGGDEEDIDVVDGEDLVEVFNGDDVFDENN